MSRQPKNILSNLDWPLVGMYLFFVLVGFLNIYAAAYSPEHKNIIDFSQEYGKQFIWICVSFLLILFVLILDAKFFSTFSYFIYLFAIAVLILTLFIGDEVNGSRSWIYFSETMRFQPLELAKFATNLVLAKFLGDIGVRMQDIGTRLKVIVFIAIPALLILLQNETGSMLVFASFIFVLYREGLSGNILIIGFALIVLFIFTLLIDKLIIVAFITLAGIVLFFLIKRSRKNVLQILLIYGLTVGSVFSVNGVYEHILQPHQKKRIDVFLGKVIDLKDKGYNVNQSKIAIGSGGLFGKGFLNGTQTKYKFVPEQNTDFIFCTIGEEWGFIGSSVVVIMFFLFLMRILFVAERQRSSFSRIYGYGLASLVFFHVMINIGMTIGLAPVVGIPLPYISYGGSSLLSFTVLLFVFIKQDANRMQVL
ncbi:MAG: rod shape-determining protein RodA [Bacteroidota bacterium]